jgi:hypothetical protein
LRPYPLTRKLRARRADISLNVCSSQVDYLGYLPDDGKEYPRWGAEYKRWAVRIVKHRPDLLQRSHVIFGEVETIE